MIRLFTVIVIGEQFREIFEIGSRGRSVNKTDIFADCIGEEIEQAEPFRPGSGKGRLDFRGAALGRQPCSFERGKTVQGIGNRIFVIPQEFQRKFVKGHCCMFVSSGPMILGERGQTIIHVNLFHRISGKIFFQAPVEFRLGGDPFRIGPVRSCRFDHLQFLGNHLTDQFGVERIHCQTTAGQTFKAGFDCRK